MTDRRYALHLLAGGLLIAAVCGDAQPAAGQGVTERTTAAARVGVDLVSRLSIIGTSGLDFGPVVASPSGTTKTIEKASPQAGRFQVLGSGNQSIEVSYSTPRVLTRQNGDETVTIDLSLYGARSEGEAGGAERVFTNNEVVLVDGRYYFFVAGSLTARGPRSNPPGIYSGAFELSVSHTDK